jgi:hypothetical protein
MQVAQAVSDAGEKPPVLSNVPIVEGDRACRLVRPVVTVHFFIVVRDRRHLGIEFGRGWRSIRLLPGHEHGR